MGQLFGWTEGLLKDFAPKRLNGFHELASAWVAMTEKNLPPLTESEEDWVQELEAEENAEQMWKAETATELAAAALAVFIASYVENAIKDLLHRAGHPLSTIDRRGRPARHTWGTMSDHWNQFYPDALDSLPEHGNVRRTCEIANSFKHEDGYPNAALVRDHGFTAGSRIDYLQCVGSEQIDEARSFVSAVYDYLRSQGMAQV